MNEITKTEVMPAQVSADDNPLLNEVLTGFKDKTPIQYSRAIDVIRCKVLNPSLKPCALAKMCGMAVTTLYKILADEMVRNAIAKIDTTDILAKRQSLISKLYDDAMAGDIKASQLFLSSTANGTPVNVPGGANQVNVLIHNDFDSKMRNVKNESD